jgi:hypothetical protein
MSIRDYLHEKAEESRHNELLAYLMFLAGAIFFVGGILETLLISENPKWLFFIPYHLQPISGATLGLSLILSGLSLLIFGITAGMFYSRDRAWYMQELHKAHSLEENSVSRKKRRKRKKVSIKM